MNSKDFDFDLFCRFYPHADFLSTIDLHIATAGGDIPEEIYSHSSHGRRRKLLKSLTENSNFEHEINPNIQEILDLKRQLWISAHERLVETEYDFEQNSYFQDFKEYAKRGCFSFDRTNVNNSNDNRYHLVAYPCIDREFSGIEPMQGEKINLRNFVIREFSQPVELFFHYPYILFEKNEEVIGFGEIY